jgi:hypothetical protein
MKRLVATLALFGVLGSSLPQTQAQDWYGGGYPVQPVQQEQYPVLKRVLIGGALFGAGFLAGRLTAPKPQQYHGYPQGGHGGGYYPQQGNGPHHGNGHHGWGRSINYQSGQNQYRY